MLCRFLNYIFALKKCCILHIEWLTSDKKKSGYQAFNEYSADKLKNKVDFIQTFIIRQLFSQSLLFF